MKKKLYRCFGISVLILMLGYLQVPAQQRSITGTVKDVSGSTIPGVSVVVKGTSIGTVTDADGTFSINANPNETLVFTFIGYKREEILITQQTRLDMTLSEDVKTLDEIVVVGYGESKRKDVTGAISSITGDEIRKTNPVTFDQALQGKVAGVVVQQISGQPGGAVSIQIRGISSFSGASPLFVIDGVIIGGGANTAVGSNPLAGINPSEIESIDVLKDASATAIYGSQATNGVVIIKTKRGQVSPPKITYDFYTGYQQVRKMLPTMNLREFATFINDRNTGLGWGFDTRPQFANPQYLGEGTNWQKELFRNAPMSNHSVTVSGGDERTQYLFSGAYFKQEGIALGSGFQRVSVRLNLDNKTTRWLKIGTSLQLVNIKENVNSTNSNVISTALSQTPDIAVKNPDGSWGGGIDPNGWVNASRMANPYALALINTDLAKRNQLFGNVYAEIEFTKNLMLRNELSGSFAMGTEDKFNPTYTMGLNVNKTNSATYSYTQNYYTIVRNYLTYSKMFNSAYNLTVMGGHEAQLNTSESVSASRINFPSNNVHAINSGDATTATNSGTKGQNALESYFGRVNFMWNDKYLFTGNVRADGSSKFAADNRWVTTYSGALAWKIQNENFLRNTPVNELKLRAGYGLTNNQNIKDYAYAATLNTISNGLSGVAQLTGNLANPLVQWEKTKYANIGLDGGILNSRINFSVDFYDRRTDGLLLSLPLPFYSGTTTGYSPGALEAPYVNVGSVSNKGFDFRISSTNLTTRGFTWRTDVTVSHNTNKIEKLNTDGASLPGYYGANVAAMSVVGRSMGQFYGYQTDGLFATANDFETHPLPINPTTGAKLPIGPSSGSIWYGDYKFKDVNGDGVIDEHDQTFLGSPIPKYQIGFNNTFTYRNFDLNVFFSANVGNKVLNGLRIQSDNPLTSFGYFKSLSNHAQLALIDPNGSASDINNVYVTNPETDIVGLRNDDTNNNNRISNRYVEDGSFIRCKTISLGYTIPEKITSKLHIHSLRIYGNVSNAFLITKYKGMDPEIGSWNPLSAGMDNGFYPQPRVFTIGANLQL
ncbi:TonB-linked outer membrane protein, SusC/RagA family [Chryseolinea serpens]|uniref:TonB-linked outer membrane protein, SusC/RagA family n=1 Tax=Chryseolinea serpens TaxID=947013 RepID=A0A1M5TV79_9BACT|nr:TonB-dependent receptor [Chryseolinea serpens]SHH54624.1 TonB-linked outer membrane protein, SusC/RagA family [Chryseolinea serpens]